MLKEAILKSAIPQEYKEHVLSGMDKYLNQPGDAWTFASGETDIGYYDLILYLSSENKLMYKIRLHELMNYTMYDGIADPSKVIEDFSKTLPLFATLHIGKLEQAMRKAKVGWLKRKCFLRKCEKLKIGEAFCYCRPDPDHHPDYELCIYRKGAESFRVIGKTKNDSFFLYHHSAEMVVREKFGC